MLTSSGTVDVDVEPGPAHRYSTASAATLDQLLAGYIDSQVATVFRADALLRSGSPAVQPTCTALRRLRSALYVFRPALVTRRAASLDADLAWCSSLAMKVQVRDVLAQRLSGQLDDLPTELVFPGARSQLSSILAEQRLDHLERFRRAMESPRYAELLNGLRAWRAEPPFTPKAKRPATKVKRYLKAAQHDLTRSLHGLSDDAVLDAPETDVLETDQLREALRAGERFRDGLALSQGHIGQLDPGHAVVRSIG